MNDVDLPVRSNLELTQIDGHFHSGNTCNLCGKVTSSHVNDHVTEYHYCGSYYKCPLCIGAARTILPLRTHFQEMHPEYNEPEEYIKGFLHYRKYFCKKNL